MPLAFILCKVESAEDAVDMAIRYAETHSVPKYLNLSGYSDYEVLGVIDAEQDVFYEPRRFTVPASVGRYHVEDVVDLFNEETARERYDQLKQDLCKNVVAEHWRNALQIIELLEGAVYAMGKKVDPGTGWWLPEVNEDLMGIRDCIIPLTSSDNEGTKYIVVIECS